MITKAQFIEQLNKNPKSKIYGFIQSCFKSGSNNGIYYSYLLSLIVYMIIMFGYTTFTNVGYYNSWPLLMLASFWLFIIQLFGLGIIGFIFYKLNIKRVKRICANLGITVEDYSKYLILYK